MANLPTTNLSLNAIHVEVGGTSGTQVSLNDSDVRGIGNPDSAYAGSDGINTTSGSMISIGEFRNAEDITYLDTETVTVKYYAASGIPGSKFYTPGFSGYLSSLSYGSSVNGLCAFKSNATINRLHVTIFGGSTNLFFSLYGTYTNAGWTTMNVAGTNYSRSSASFSQFTSSGQNLTRWTWNNISSNPFGTTDGATKVVTWV